MFSDIYDKYYRAFCQVRLSVFSLTLRVAGK